MAFVAIRKHAMISCPFNTYGTAGNVNPRPNLVQVFLSTFTGLTRLYLNPQHFAAKC